MVPIARGDRAVPAPAVRSGSEGPGRSTEPDRLEPGHSDPDGRAPATTPAARLGAPGRASGGSARLAPSHLEAGGGPATTTSAPTRDRLTTPTNSTPPGSTDSDPIQAAAGSRAEDGADRCPRAGVTVVVPCRDEEATVEAAYRETIAALSDREVDLIFVDDGSQDGTLPALRRLAAADGRVRYVSFTRNFGFEAAFSVGYRYARQPWTLLLDADLQFPPNEARKLLARAADGYDAVYGVRETHHDRLIRRVASRAFHFIGRRVLRIEIPRRATTFRVVRTSVARRIVGNPLTTPYFTATVPAITSRYTTVRIGHRPREHGRSRFRLGGLVTHALDLYFGFSRRLAGALVGLPVLAAVGLVVLGSLTAIGVLSGGAALTATLVAQGLLLVGLSGLARYLIMVFAAGQRPFPYLIREANFPVDTADLLDPDSQLTSGAMR